MKWHDIPIKLSEEVPRCSECGEHMGVMTSARMDTQVATCLQCGHQQPFPWHLETVGPESHWWVRNL